MNYKITDELWDSEIVKTEDEPNAIDVFETFTEAKREFREKMDRYIRGAKSAKKVLSRLRKADITEEG